MWPLYPPRPMPNDTTELASQYNPAENEADIGRKWTEADAFRADPDAPGEPFSICIPPPNVTAALHLGHALNNTIQDILTRHARMRGLNAVWLPGTDHAGIATQTVVDRRLQAEGQPSLRDYKQQEAENPGQGRGAFVAKVQAWKDESTRRRSPTSSRRWAARATGAGRRSPWTSRGAKRFARPFSGSSRTA